MRKTVFGMAAAVVLFAILAVLRGGWGTLARGLVLGASTAVQIAPLLVAAFAVAGLISVLISEEQVSRWLGRESGFKGILLAALAGALVPGGPYVYFPLAATFLMAGAEIGTVVAFVTAKNLWTLSRLPLEMALLTPEITAIRYAVTFIFPPLLGLWANVLFAKQTPPIRQGIRALQHTDDTKEGS